MKKPTLVVMAAGMGSRFGGIKQIAPVSEDGHIILDYSIHDAYAAGFRDVVFIIKEELRGAFDEVIGDRVRKFMNVTYVYQSMDKHTGGKVPEGRIKPLGTGHAVLCAKDVIDGPFVVINADDFYGVEPYALMYQFLSNPDLAPGEYALAGYQVERTLTDNGDVTRGVCAVNDQGYITQIDERKKIRFVDGQPAYADGQSYIKIQIGTPVSMNMIGFGQDFLEKLDQGFPGFMESMVRENPAAGEYLIPVIVNELIQTQSVSVKLLQTAEQWYGITYQEDLPAVRQAIKSLHRHGLYSTLGFSGK